MRGSAKEGVGLWTDCIYRRIRRGAMGEFLGEDGEETGNGKYYRAGGS